MQIRTKYDDRRNSGFTGRNLPGSPLNKSGFSDTHARKSMRKVFYRLYSHGIRRGRLVGAQSQIDFSPPSYSFIPDIALSQVTYPGRSRCMEIVCSELMFSIPHQIGSRNLKQKHRERVQDMDRVRSEKECSFKPLISPNSLSLLRRRARPLPIFEYLFADAKTRLQRLELLSNLTPSFCWFQPRFIR